MGLNCDVVVNLNEYGIICNILLLQFAKKREKEKKFYVALDIILSVWYYSYAR